jgi:hypothetical protein
MSALHGVMVTTDLMMHHVAYTCAASMHVFLAELPGDFVAACHVIRWEHLPRSCLAALIAYSAVAAARCATVAKALRRWCSMSLVKHSFGAVHFMLPICETLAAQWQNTKR